MALDDLPFEAVQHACQEVFRHETFMPVPAIMRSYAKAWTKKQQVRCDVTPTQEEMLALREELVSQEQVRALIASVWPETLG